MFLTSFISHRPAQVSEGAPIRGKCLLVLKFSLRASGLRLEHIPYERGLFLVFIAGDAKLLRGRFVSGAGRLEKQSGLLPLAVLGSDFDRDLRFCFA